MYVASVCQQVDGLAPDGWAVLGPETSDSVLCLCVCVQTRKHTDEHTLAYAMSMARWQEDHPIWRDSQFTNPPTAEGRDILPAPACRAVAPGPPPAAHAAAPSCNSGQFLNDTKLQCGKGFKFTQVGGR